MTFAVLLFAHLLADYPLQGDFLAKTKGERVLLMLSHCGIWTGCIGVASHFCGISVTSGMLAALFVVHFVADEFKARGGYRGMNPLGTALWLDQGIHVLQIAALIHYWR